jgi:hypothetical protein
VTSVPKDPDAFFGSYVPETFAQVAEPLRAVTSSGSIVFRIGSREPFAFRLVAGQLGALRQTPDDTLVQVTLAEDDFEPILVRGAEQLELSLGAPEKKLAAFRALLIDAERAALIRSVQGSLALELTGERAHRLVLTPSTRSVTPEAECTVRCALSDFWAMQRGDSNPFELMMNGKIQISGDAQIVMSLSSLFV